MMRRWVLAAALLGLLVTPSSLLGQESADMARSAAWTTMAGNAARSGEAALSPGPWDVVRIVDLAPGQQRVSVFRSPGVVATAHGLVGMTYTPDLSATPVRSGNCRWFLDASLGGPDASAVVAHSAPWLCTGQRSTVWTNAGSYDELRDIVLWCEYGTERDAPMVSATRVATWEPLWALSAADLGLPDPGPTSTSQQGGTGYGCEEPALDSALGQAFVGAGYFGDDQRSHVLARIDVDEGIVRWAEPIGNNIEEVPVPRPEPLQAEPVPMGFEYVTLSGEFVGVQDDASSFSTGGLAVLDRNGTVVAARYFSADPEDGSQQPADDRVTSDFCCSDWPAARDGRFAVVMESVLVVADAESGTVREQPLGAIPANVPSAEYVRGAEGLRWIDGRILHSGNPCCLLAFSDRDLRLQWEYVGPPGEAIEDLVIVPDQSVFLVAQNYTTYRAWWIELDLGDGALVHRTPIDLGDRTAGVDASRGVGDPANRGFRPVPLSAREVLVYRQDGRAALLSDAPSAWVPAPQISASRPDPGDMVRVTLPLQTDRDRPRHYVVGWGDGGPAITAAPGTFLEHEYNRTGRFRLSVTAVYSDATTGTATATIDVGAPPPVEAELNFLQRAFSPEFQEWTFFVLGLGVMGLGGAYGATRYRRGRTAVARQLAALEQIRASSRSDVVGAAADLARLRQGLVAGIQAGRFTDSQFAALEARAQSVLGVLTERLVGPMRGRASPGLERAITVALEDGRIDAEEARVIDAQVQRQRKLADDDRDVIARFVQALRVEPD